MSDEGKPEEVKPQAPFRRACAETLKGVKNDVANKGGIEPQVKEQVTADIDRLIDGYEAPVRKSWPL